MALTAAGYTPVLNVLVHVYKYLHAKICLYNDFRGVIGESVVRRRSSFRILGLENA